MDAVKPDRFNSEIEAFAVCYSYGLGGVAYISPSRKMGYFTVALVDGLKGGAVSPGDPLRRVTGESKRLLGSGRAFNAC